MATSGSFATAYYKHLCMQVSWLIKSQSIENNTTTLSWTLKGLRDDTATGYITCGGFKVVIDGTTVYSKSTDYRVDVYNGTVVASGEITIAHDAEGKKSFTGYVEAGIYYHSVNSSGSGTFTLTDIPRVSVPTLSASSVNFGSAITVYTNRKSSSFTHHLYYSVNGGAEVGITPDIGTSFTWTVPYDLISKIAASDKKATIMFRLYTFNGETNIGNNTISFTATVPDNSTTKPTVSMMLSPVGSLPSAFSGLYIQGKTKVKATLSATGKYGATIKSYSMSAEGGSYGSKENYTSGLLMQYGTRSITGYATDSRDFTGNTSQSITVIAYSKPTISAQAYRCDANGNKSSTGTYLRISATRSYAKVMSGSTQKNFCLIRYRYKLTSASSYSAWTTILAGNSTSSDSVTTGALLSGVLSVSSSYLVQIQALDDIGEYAETTITISTEAIHTHKTKNGLGLGKYSEKENTLDMGWGIELNGNDIYKNGVKAFAPHGYGLGGSNKWLGDSDDIDNMVDIGWCSVGVNNTSPNKPFDYPDIFTSFRRSTTSGQQIARSGSTISPLFKVRNMHGGTWGEWEWVNPPMELGVEYRTTKRHNGKIVYVTRLTVGELVNKGTTQTTLPNTPTEIVELYGTAKSDAYTETVTFPILTSAGATGARLIASGTKNIVAKTYADYSGYVAIATVEYTKD